MGQINIHNRAILPYYGWQECSAKNIFFMTLTSAQFFLQMTITTILCNLDKKECRNLGSNRFSNMCRRLENVKELSTYIGTFDPPMRCPIKTVT